MLMQVYKDDGSSTLRGVVPVLKSKVGETPRVVDFEVINIQYTEYENWCIDQIVRDYKASGEEYTPLLPHQVAEMFADCPETKKDISGILSARRKDIGVELEGLKKADQDIAADEELRKHKNKELREAMEGVNEAKRSNILEERQNNDFILSFYNPKKRKSIADFQIKLQQAKAVRIDKLLTFNRQKKTQCLWHVDKDPSLYYYKKDNRVHCFVCEQGGDAIDVVRKQKGCSLGDAIGFLTNT